MTTVTRFVMALVVFGVFAAGVFAAGVADAQTLSAYAVWGQGRVRIQEVPALPSSGASGVVLAAELLFARKYAGAIEFGSTNYGATTLGIQGLFYFQFQEGQKLVPFVAGGYNHASGTRAGTGPDLGAGANYWIRKNVAIRGEFNRWTMRRTFYGLEQFFPRNTDEYRTVRVGLAFRWDD